MTPLSLEDVHRLASEAHRIAIGDSKARPRVVHLIALIRIASDLAAAYSERGDVIAALMRRPVHPTEARH